MKKILVLILISMMANTSFAEDIVNLPGVKNVKIMVIRGPVEADVLPQAVIKVTMESCPVRLLSLKTKETSKG